MNLYPLKFQTVCKERVWGGRNLEKYGFDLPPGSIGEAWTISEHPSGMTEVTNGFLKGSTLDQLRESYGQQIFGRLGISQKTGRFPLLIKILDCEDHLSVQVHPNDHYPNLAAGELGKTEMWYILEAKPGAKIIYGLQPGVNRDHLAQAIAENRIMDVLQEIEVYAGDAFYIPAGTVHALGAGILLAEIQQNSDTTYRLYDYERIGLDGKLRPLHIEDSLNVISYENTGSERISHTDTKNHEWMAIAKSVFFVVEKGQVADRWDLATSPESFTILVVAKGQISIQWDNQTLPLQIGDCILLPAQLGDYSLCGEGTLLRSYIPG